jgi:hypothetical protein
MYNFVTPNWSGDAYTIQRCLVISGKEIIFLLINKVIYSGSSVRASPWLQSSIWTNEKSIKRLCTRMVQFIYFACTLIFSRKKAFYRWRGFWNISLLLHLQSLKCCSSSYWIAKNLTIVAFFYTENSYCFVRVYKHHYLLLDNWRSKTKRRLHMTSFLPL